VVLSGCGDDGTPGSRAVRAAGGVVLAQDPHTSERSEMPIAAFDVGKVHVVLRPDQIGPALCALTIASAEEQSKVRMRIATSKNISRFSAHCPSAWLGVVGVMDS
jgi:two-component system, chemotaxis family, CheB/CheR fusion protein